MAVVSTEEILRRRVRALRPALELAVKQLREVYPNYEQHHEGGEIWRVIEIGEKAMAETAGPTPRAPEAVPQPEPSGEVVALKAIARCLREVIEAMQSDADNWGDGPKGQFAGPMLRHIGRLDAALRTALAASGPAATGEGA